LEYEEYDKVEQSLTTVSDCLKYLAPNDTIVFAPDITHIVATKTITKYPHTLVIAKKKKKLGKGNRCPCPVEPSTLNPFWYYYSPKPH